MKNDKSKTNISNFEMKHSFSYLYILDVFVEIYICMQDVQPLKFRNSHY